MFDSTHPIVLAAVICGVLALTALITAWLVRRIAVRMLMIFLAVIFIVPAAFVFVALNPWLVDSRFRTYRAFYKEIQIGMTRGEVLSAMERHYPAGGPRKRPKIWADASEELVFVMTPETSREPYCEGILLALKKGCVTKKDYSPD